METTNPESSSAKQLLLKRTQCLEVLESLLKRTPAVMFACLSTVDGRTVAHAAGQREIAPQRVAAITTSLLSLSESFAKEVLRGTCLHTTIAIDHGTVVAVRVPSQARTHALSVCADRGDNLAMTLRWTLDAAGELARVIDQAG